MPARPLLHARHSIRPEYVLASRTARAACRSGLLWGYIFGAVVASSAIGYTTAYKTLGQRERFAALFANSGGLAALVGPGFQLQTVAGYTIWKSYMFLIVCGAAWGLLISTRLTRGEEEAGRWELYLAGPTNRRRAVAQVMLGLGAALSVLWSVCALITVVVGRDSKVGFSPSAALYFALCLVSGAAVFIAIGLCSAQLAATRRQAAGYAAIVLGVSYALRLVADSGTGLRWLRWLTPIGWIQQLQPLTQPDPVFLLPLAALTGLACVAALQVAATRDLGSAVLRDRGRVDEARLSATSPVRLGLRLSLQSTTTWVAALAATGMLMGYVAKQGGKILTSSSTIRNALAHVGASGGGAADYLGITFLLIALLCGVIAAGQLSAIRAEESSGRLSMLLVRSVSRKHWLASRILICLAVVASAAMASALFAWFGAVSQDSGLSLGRLLLAGLNMLPPAFCVAGLGTLVLGLAPRVVNAATYGLLTWSLLLELTGGFFTSNHWLLDTSVFHQMAYVPAVTPDWTSWGILLALAAAATAAGLIGFRRRDLAEDHG